MARAALVYRKISDDYLSSIILNVLSIFIFILIFIFGAFSTRRASRASQRYGIVVLVQRQDRASPIIARRASLAEHRGQNLGLGNFNALMQTAG